MAFSSRPQSPVRVPFFWSNLRLPRLTLRPVRRTKTLVKCTLNAYLFVERLVGEFAVLSVDALETSVKKFTRKIMMHVKTLVTLRATVHQIKFAELHFSGRQSIVWERTVVPTMTFSLHVVQAYRVGILTVILILIPSAVPVVSLLCPTFVFPATLVFSTTSTYVNNCK